MLQRVKSFSKGGANIERVLSVERYKIDQDKLNKILSSQQSPLQSSTHKNNNNRHLEAFDKVTGRQKPNSFLLFNIRDDNSALNYEVKQIIRPTTTVLPIRKEQRERLSDLQVKDVYKSRNQPKFICRKLQQTNNEHIKTTKDLQETRKTFHSIDFQKQTERPFDKHLKKVSSFTNKPLQLTKNNSQSHYSQQPSQNLQKQIQLRRTHSFASYTNRDYLSQKKLRCAPEVSGIDSYKINPQKFKGNWKTINPPKFEQIVDKHLNRYDRDCPPWYTQLAYNVKHAQTSRSPRDFNKQTIRQQNLVQSKYPIRIAI